MRRILFLVSALSTCLQGSSVFAHPGHGQNNQGNSGQQSNWMHYIVEPEHFVWLLLLAGVIATICIAAYSTKAHRLIAATIRSAMNR